LLKVIEACKERFIYPSKYLAVKDLRVELERWFDIVNTPVIPTAQFSKKGNQLAIIDGRRQRLLLIAYHVSKEFQTAKVTYPYRVLCGFH